MLTHPLLACAAKLKGTYDLYGEEVLKSSAEGEQGRGPVLSRAGREGQGRAAQRSTGCVAVPDNITLKAACSIVVWSSTVC
jgi:hypothetical protein